MQTTLQDFKNKKIGILGLGIEGISSAKFLAEKDARVTLLDKRELSAFAAEERERIVSIKASHRFGKEYLSQLGDFDIIVRSPGIKRNLPELAAAEEEGVVITSQTRIFFDLCPAPIIGVTGTKGKGTTASLIYEMLQKSGFDSHIGGNIGHPPLDFLGKLTKESRVILELSSFQLQDLHKSPHIAVLLMITSEHLDYHASAEEYIDAKRNILRFQDTSDYAVINRDYLPSHESDVFTSGKVFQVSLERPSTGQGCFVKDGALWVRMEGAEWKILDTKDVALPGKHNIENACAAVMAATLAGAAKDDVVEVLRTFQGLPHRLELVREVEGVKYYDDSFSTTPETAIAAIEAFEHPEIIVLGGSSKKSDFAELGNVVSQAKNIKAIIGVGSEWRRIKEQFHSLPEHVLLIEGAESMEKIVKAASAIAKPGDIVILSPACASFDMFKSYKDRGEQFKREVEAL